MERVPDDGLHYEVINGSLHVTPPAGYQHNRRAQHIGLALLAAAPSGLDVLMTGKQAVRLGEDGPCPDVVVFAPGDYTVAVPAEAVLLIVEVTIPGKPQRRHRHQVERYARGGIPHYWVVDPDRITV